MQKNPKNRHGAILALELLVVLPILVLMLVALVEFSLLWSANLRVKEASRAASRVASLPTANTTELYQATHQAAVEALGERHLIDHFRLDVDPGRFSGDRVGVAITVPMSAAAPDMLKVIGFSLQDRVLRGETVMRKE